MERDRNAPRETTRHVIHRPRVRSAARGGGGRDRHRRFFGGAARRSVECDGDASREATWDLIHYAFGSEERRLPSADTRGGGADMTAAVMVTRRRTLRQ